MAAADTNVKSSADETLSVAAALLQRATSRQSLMSDTIFSLLTGSAVFDHERFQHDIRSFSQAAAEETGTRRHRNKRRHELVSGTHAQQNCEIGHDDERLLKRKHGTQRRRAVEKERPDADTSVERAYEAADSGAEADALRVEYGITVSPSGANCPSPLRSFADVSGQCAAALLKNVASAGFREPTAIQRQALPALLSGNDVYAIAPTGSGKTLAFLLPALVHSMKARAGKAGEGPVALCVSPTRELAAQTARVLKQLLPGTGCRGELLRPSLVAQHAALRRVDALSATPLMLCEAVEAGKVTLRHVRLLVLDEADKLFEEKRGFLKQIDAILAAAQGPADAPRPCPLQIALFSATLPAWVQTVAGSVLHDPLHITVGTKNAASMDVDQSLLFVGKESGKLLQLRQMIGEGLAPPVLVFVASKDRAKALHRELAHEAVHVDAIHADQTHTMRTAAVESFRAGDTWILICTDLLARGMDFVGVNTVINYDFPSLTSDYIHRVGRTGRAGRRGRAVTFFVEDDAPRLQAIANCMRRVGCHVPEWMLLLKRGRAKKSMQHEPISSTAAYDERMAQRKAQIVRQSRAKHRGVPQMSAIMGVPRGSA